MDPKEIANLIEAGLPGSRAEVRTDGQGHYEALVIAEEFADLRSLRRHQKVYATLGRSRRRGDSCAGAEDVHPGGVAGESR